MEYRFLSFNREHHLSNTASARAACSMGYATVDVICGRCIPQKTGGNQAVPFLCGCAGPKTKKPWLALGAVGAVWLGFNGAAALAQPAPMSLDQALKDTLGLETNGGCPSGFRDPALVNPGDFGPQLTAICQGGGGNASAAALGGSLGSLQTTKTASQFRLARRRVDRGRNPHPKPPGAKPPGGKRFALSGSTLLANLDQPSRLNNFSVFTQLEYEWRDRATTPLEASYEAKISEGLIGFDFAMPNKLLVGAWVGYGNIGADYTGTNLGANPPPNLFNSCGQLSVSGGFNDVGVKLGGFVAGRFGRGYGDVAAQYSNRDYDYHRNSCVIRGNDVFAGTLSGQTTRTEGSISARTGYDFGNERFLWGPRVSLTYVTSKIDAFTETGQASVGGGLNGLPTVGNSTGLELAFDQQSRASLQSEAQFVAAYRFEQKFGTLIPRVSTSWIHEFKGERKLVTVHMAQDYRTTPTRFSFTTDSADKNKGVIAVGVTALLNMQLAADLEVARLVADDNFDATTITAQARWSF